MSVSTSALITVEEYAQYDGRASDQSLSDMTPQLEAFINAVSAQVAVYCDRDGFVSGTASEIFDDYSGKDKYLRNTPVLADPVPVLSYYDYATSAWVTLDATSYPRLFVSNAGRLLCIGWTFNCELQYKVDYSYGVAQSAIPADLKRAVYQLVQRAMKKSGFSGKEGLTSESMGDSTTSYDLNDIPKDISKVLDTYKRFLLA